MSQEEPKKENNNGFFSGEIRPFIMHTFGYMVVFFIGMSFGLDGRQEATEKYREEILTLNERLKNSKQAYDDLFKIKASEELAAGIKLQVKGPKKSVLVDCGISGDEIVCEKLEGPSPSN